MQETPRGAEGRGAAVVRALRALGARLPPEQVPSGLTRAKATFGAGKKVMSQNTLRPQGHRVITTKGFQISLAI